MKNRCRNIITLFTQYAEKKELKRCFNSFKCLYSVAKIPILRFLYSHYNLNIENLALRCIFRLKSSH